MPRKYSLSDKLLIQQCAQKGRKSFQKHTIIKYLPAVEKKFAIVVAKTVSKKAVVRNRYRRQIKSILHQHIAQIPHGLYLIVVKNLAEEPSFDLFYKDLSTIFS